MRHFLFTYLILFRVKSNAGCRTEIGRSRNSSGWTAASERTTVTSSSPFTCPPPSSSGIQDPASRYKSSQVLFSFDIVSSGEMQEPVMTQHFFFCFFRSGRKRSRRICADSTSIPSTIREFWSQFSF